MSLQSSQFSRLFHSRGLFKYFNTLQHFDFCRRMCEGSSTVLEGLRLNFSGENMKQDEVQPTILIRALCKADLPKLRIVGSQLDGTDPLPSVQSWMKQDPGGIQIALNGRGEIIGACSGVKNGDDDDGLYFMGMFFVLPEYQKLGIGRLLWNLIIRHTKAQNTALNAVPGKLETYRDACGFHVQETRFTTMEYHSHSWPLDFTFLADTPPPGISICPFHSSHLPAIFAYDFRLVGFKRTTTLTMSLMEEGSWTLVAIRNDGSCAGFGMIKRTCGGGARVGPLYADGPEVAEVLLRKLGEMVINEPMKVFGFVTTSANRRAMQWMDRLGIGIYEVCDRLYTEKKLDVDLDKVYGLCDSNFSPF